VRWLNRWSGVRTFFIFFFILHRRAQLITLGGSMKRFVIVFGCLLVAVAFAAPSDVLFPSKENVERVCTESHQTAKANDFRKNLAVLDGELGRPNYVAFQSPLGSLKSTCAFLGKQLKKLVIPNEVPGLVAVGGQVTELTEARDWAAVFTVEKDGVETARLFPNDTSEAGSIKTWKVNCTGGCKWTGSNYYYFDFGQEEFKQAVLDGGDVKIIVQKNGEIKTFSFPTVIE
jgi:hypothetical protein